MVNHMKYFDTQHTQASGCGKTFAFATEIVIQLCSACNGSACDLTPDAGLHKYRLGQFPGLAWDLTRATCVVLSHPILYTLYVLVSRKRDKERYINIDVT
jgi:hypothetical protein